MVNGMGTPMHRVEWPKTYLFLCSRRHRDYLCVTSENNQQQDDNRTGKLIRKIVIGIYNLYTIRFGLMTDLTLHIDTVRT